MAVNTATIISYVCTLKDKVERPAIKNNCPFVDNQLPYYRAEHGHLVIVNYFYHEQIRSSENTERRKHL